MLGGKFLIYHINSMIEGNNQKFMDESHIIYVNAKITDETELGKLMQDFHCSD